MSNAHKNITTSNDEKTVIDEKVSDVLTEVDDQTVIEEPEENANAMPAVVYATVAIDDSKKLNVRQSPSYHCPVVGKLDPGETIIIDKTKSNDDWFRIEHTSGLSGYCMKKYIRLNE